MAKKTLTIILLFLPFVLFGQTIKIDSSSIGTASRDYSTIQGWEDAKDGDLVTQDSTRKGVCYDDSDFNELVDIDGSTTSDSTFMWLTVVGASRNDGTAYNGAVIDYSGASHGNGVDAIDVIDPWTRVDWLIIRDWVTAGNADGISIEAADCHFKYMIIADGSGSGFISSGGDNSIVDNSIVHDMGIDGFQGGAGTTDMTWRNCTAYNNGQDGFDGIDTGNPDNIALNCLSIDNTTDYSNVDAAAGADFNGSGDTSASVFTNNDQNMVATTEFVSVTGGSEDLHIKTGATSIDAGNTIAAITDDIDGDSRPQGSAYDYGVDELVVVGTREIIVF